jgi:hypothetical protein
LFDFNPSPHSYKYYGVVELRELFARFGFNVKLYGYMDVRSVSMRQRILRPIKFLASKARIIPGSTHGKKWLKRIVFGGLVKMPREIGPQGKQNDFKYVEPTGISSSRADTEHKVIYCEASFE